MRRANAGYKQLSLALQERFDGFTRLLGQMGGFNSPTIRAKLASKTSTNMVHPDLDVTGRYL